MTRSMNRSCERSSGITSRVVTSWIALFGTEVRESAADITVEMAMKDSVDSLPPVYVYIDRR